MCSFVGPLQMLHRLKSIISGIVGRFHSAAAGLLQRVLVPRTIYFAQLLIRFPTLVNQYLQELPRASPCILWDAEPLFRATLISYKFRSYSGSRDSNPVLL